MIHIWRESKESKRVLVLFHGTGGDEHDLLGLARAIDPAASILSLRGNVSEQGMLRFFRRISPGIFDQENIVHEAKAISQFLLDFALIHSRDVADFVFVGFSNGANMIVALSLLYPTLVRTALILHGLQPLERLIDADLSKSRMFVSLGAADTMIPARETLSLISVLRSRGAEVTVFRDEGGHHITDEEIEAAQQFIA